MLILPGVLHWKANADDKNDFSFDFLFIDIIMYRHINLYNSN